MIRNDSDDVNVYPKSLLFWKPTMLWDIMRLTEHIIWYTALLKSGFEIKCMNKLRLFPYSGNFQYT